MTDALTRVETLHHCREAGNAFQRRARLLQSIWREGQGYPMGIHTGRHGERLLGSRLVMPWAEETLANYLTDTIRDTVRTEVLDPVRSQGKLFARPRIFDDLLSSQPMCFNLFAELKANLSLATAVFRDITVGRVCEVTAIEFEHSPGRGDPRYTGDRSAFDVFVEFTTASGGDGFLGIEVKYHEDLKGKPSSHKARYDEVAENMGCFRTDNRDRLRAMPLQQIWRDHLLAGALRSVDGYDDGMFVFLRPRGNAACAEAVKAYQVCLTDDGSFAEWILEDVVEALRKHTDAEWVDQFHDRYLAFERVDSELARIAADSK